MSWIGSSQTSLAYISAQAIPLHPNPYLAVQREGPSLAASAPPEKQQRLLTLEVTELESLTEKPSQIHQQTNHAGDSDMY